MTVINIFDPPMCCSTGVCGPEVDPVLPRFAADLDWLAGRGVEVQRFNLAQQPKAFADNPLVMKALREVGNEVLPLIVVNGVVASQGRYPNREELAKMASSVVAGDSIVTDAVKELIAIGAAIAANCEPCLKFHFDKAKKLGVSTTDLRLAVSVAQAVKEAPARSVLEFVDRCLGDRASTEPAPRRLAVAGCCGPASGSGSGTDGSGGCC